MKVHELLSNLIRELKTAGNLISTSSKTMESTKLRPQRELQRQLCYIEARLEILSLVGKNPFVKLFCLAVV